MNISKLNTKIIIQKNEIIQDEIGNQELLWNDYYCCFASISGYNGDEKDDSTIVESIEKLSFTIRYCNAASRINGVNYRVILDNKIYNIIGVDLMSNYKKTLKLKCELMRC